MGGGWAPSQISSFPEDQQHKQCSWKASRSSENFSARSRSEDLLDQTHHRSTLRGNARVRNDSICISKYGRFNQEISQPFDADAVKVLYILTSLQDLLSHLPTHAQFE
jgi:hypothetical protein